MKFIAAFHARWPLVQIAHERSETARKFRFADGRGEIGLIAPVSQPFCGHCSRIRLTADGKLRTCLFSKDDHDLKFLLRGGASDEEIRDEIISIVAQKEKGHRINEPGFCASLAHHGFHWRIIIAVERRRLSFSLGNHSGRIVRSVVHRIGFGRQIEMADEESKLFSLKEAERLRVQLEPILIEAMEVRRKMAGFDEQLVAVAERIQRSGGMQVPYEKVAKTRVERNRLQRSAGNCSGPDSGNRLRGEGSRHRPARFPRAN